jgi:RNA recognition motif-containing protein
MTIFVSNLSFNIQDDDLEGFFTEFGTVTSARVITDKSTNRSRGFGFVEMPNRAEAEAAIAALDGGIADGREVRVSEAQPSAQRSKPRQFSNR